MLGSPESGFLNQFWRALGGSGHVIDINTPYGIAWVMALFEGSVAFVMIGAVMKSMDPALEEASQVIGASRLRTMLRVTLPLVIPGVLGAAIFVFAEMLGSFAVALVLGTPNRYYVITTAIYQLIQQYPPRIQVAAAMGTSLFAVMFVMLFIYRRIVTAAATSRSPARRSGRASPTWDGCGTAVLRVCALSRGVGRPADRDIALCIGPEDRRRISRRR
jgi:iron(III) transport system permease protein